MNKICFFINGNTWIDTSDFLELVADVHSISTERILKGNRERSNVVARAAAMFMLKSYTPLTFKEIADIFGVDHSSVVYHTKSVDSKKNIGFGKEYLLLEIKNRIKLFHKEYSDDSVNDLIQSCVEWGNRRGLSDPKVQSMKLMEEVGELMAAILKNDKEQQVDAVGDIMVVLAILSNQIGVSIPTALKVAFNEIKDRTGKTINGAFIKQQDL